jgi:YD repeat-containing protein
VYYADDLTTVLTRKRTGQCAFPRTGIGGGPGIEGTVFATETRDAGGTVLEGHYYGNTGAFGDSAALGTVYLDFETAGLASGGSILDMRPTKTVHYRDGVYYSETFAYNDITAIPADHGYRNSGNVTSKTTYLGATDTGSWVAQTQTYYFHPPAYVARNLIRLPQDASVTDPAYGVLSRTHYDYDEYSRDALMDSGRPGLDRSMAEVRGNATTVTADGQFAVQTTFWDTGDPNVVRDPLGHRLTHTIDGRQCTSTSTLSTSVQNELSHNVTTVVDCFTGAALSVTDPIGAMNCSEYDNVGRLMDTAGPGDGIRGQGVHDSGCPTGSPEIWIDYPNAGKNLPQDTIAHVRDGTSDGHYTKSYFDGLSRTLATCSEVDPATSGGFQEACRSTEYDAMGRVSKQYVPFFSAGTSAAPSGVAQYTEKLYDALGRLTREALKLAGNDVVSDDGRANATTFGYMGSGASFITDATNPRGFHTKTTTDVLGHQVQAASEDNSPGGCAGGYCTTVTNHDAAGQLRAVIDSTAAGSTVCDDGSGVKTYQGIATCFQYDGRGHRTAMQDPDMGSWTYEYDAAGNLTAQTDAKHQRIEMHYDALDRLTWKDLPPTGPGPEDIVNTYDGTLPTCGCSGGPGQVCCNPPSNDLCSASTLTCLPPPQPDGGVGATVDAATNGPQPPAPTATLTANAATSITVNVGDTVNYVWSSTYADSGTSTVNTNIQDACGTVSGSPWGANDTGNHGSGAIAPCQAGVTYTLTYTARQSSTGRTATSTVTVKVNPPPPTASLTANGATDITVNVGDWINYVWSATNADSATSTVTTNIQDACGTVSGSPWSANDTNNGAGGTIASCQSGVAYTLTYTAWQSSTGRTANAQVIVRVNRLVYRIIHWFGDSFDDWGCAGDGIMPSDNCIQWSGGNCVDDFLCTVTDWSGACIDGWEYTPCSP